MESNKEFEEMCLKYQRDVNCLLDQERNIRRQSLIKFKREIVSNKFSKKAWSQFCNNLLIKNLLYTLGDKVEAHRESSMTIVEKMVEELTDLEEDKVCALIRKLCDRLSDLPFPEKSEELRLIILNLIVVFIKQYPEQIKQCLKEIGKMLSKILQDDFPAAKKEACNLITKLCDKYPSQFGSFSKIYLIPLANNLRHQHSRVRRITLKAITQLLLIRDTGEFFIDLKPYFDLILGDKNSSIRKQAYESFGQFLDKFSYGELRDHEHNIVQLVLNGLQDEDESIQEYVIGLLDQSGKNRITLEKEMNPKKNDIKEFYYE